MFNVDLKREKRAQRIEFFNEKKREEKNPSWYFFGEDFTLLYSTQTNRIEEQKSF
jgi:hypothetical protein